jgi:hypothetical protein
MEFKRYKRGHMESGLNKSSKADVTEHYGKDFQLPGGSGLIKLLNQGYVCPPDAGPAWKAALQAGVDMGMIEDALRMSPQERLEAHQRALNLVIDLSKSREDHDSSS